MKRTESLVLTIDRIGEKVAIVQGKVVRGDEKGRRHVIRQIMFDGGFMGAIFCATVCILGMEVLGENLTILSKWGSRNKSLACSCRIGPFASSSTNGSWKDPR